jgi:hypothetical protein
MTRKTLGIYIGTVALAVALAGAFELSGVQAAASNANAARAASILGVLSPVRAASAQNVAPATMIGHLDTYEMEMKTALKISDPVRRNAAIGVARGNLATSSNKQLTPLAIMRIDTLLGLPDSPPLLGTTSR